MIDQLNNSLSHTLYGVSSALLLPILLAVLLLFLAALIMLGGFLREACDRRRTRAALRRTISLLDSGDSSPRAVFAALRTAPSGLPLRFGRNAAKHPATPAALSKALADLEAEITVTLGRIGFIARVGPMLGLLGTLIPFGPALAGLSSGNVQELSSNLVTAFATTVIGLLCGVLAFTVASVRRGWYTKDSDDLDHIVQCLSQNHSLYETSQDQEMGANGRRSNIGVDQPV
jgi:biopolymer transport protein ExbB/TolQ